MIRNPFTMFVAAALASVLFAVPLMAQKGRRGADQPPAAGPVIHLDPAVVANQMTSSRDDAMDVNNQSSLARYLKAFEATQSTDDRQQIITELTDFCVQRGLRPCPDLAEMLLAMAAEARAQGRSTEATQLVRHAESFDPESPLVHLALAESARKDTGFFSGGFLYEVGAAFFLSFKDVETRSLALSNLARWMRVSALFVLAAFAMTLLVRYQAQLRHDVQEWLGGGESALVHAVGAILLLLPSLIFLAGYWWIVYWAGIFMLYARWSERVATFMAIAVFVASGAVAVRWEQDAYLAMSQPHASNIRCHANRIGVGLDASLSSHIQGGDRLQRPFTFLLASRYLLHGSYAKADSLFQSLLAGGADDAEVHNNLGCILFYENRYQEAIQQFSKAIELKADFAAAFLNRSFAETKIFDFTGAKDDQDKARVLDKGLIQAGKMKQADEWTPLPSWLPLEQTHKLATEQEMSRPGSLTGVLRPSLSPLALVLRPAFSFWALALWVFFTVFAIAKKPKFFAHACFKCGRPFCSRCKTSLEFESFCSQCVHLYIKQDGVSPEARLKKNYEVERYSGSQRIQRAAFSLLAPGSGHILEGRPLAALVILGLWCGCLGALLVGLYALPFSFPSLASAQPLRVVAAALAALMMVMILVLFGVPAAMRREIRRPGQAGRG